MRESEDRSRRALVLEDAVALLSSTPPTLDALLRGLPADWRDANEGGDTLARQYTDEVGPWLEYLRIVRDAPAWRRGPLPSVSLARQRA